MSHYYHHHRSRPISPWSPTIQYLVFIQLFLAFGLLLDSAWQWLNVEPLNGEDRERGIMNKITFFASVFTTFSAVCNITSYPESLAVPEVVVPDRISFALWAMLNGDMVMKLGTFDDTSSLVNLVVKLVLCAVLVGKLIVAAVVRERNMSSDEEEAVTEPRMAVLSIDGKLDVYVISEPCFESGDGIMNCNGNNGNKNGNDNKDS
ncbi:hypothetical protein BZA77DRAFT_316172 [Pyronema omphalodes]|nr:hypothetical protein BZA77DRAFT_316172 [Pyronema omphalodes]